MQALPVAIVPHTHWDREWYQPFETFRGRLVSILDRLLPLLDADPSYRHFLLDGQLAAVDDYIAVRPDAAQHLRRLVSAGRVEIGPWYTLPDEFCVSGETLVRDLQLGLDRAAFLGGAMEVGYLPDMFGHVAQMPQLLRLFGLDRAVVWRGVPEAVDRTRFWWSAPDGSTVRAEYLWWGYSIGASIVDDPGALVARVRELVAELGPAVCGGLLFMNGTDHQAPQPWLGRVVDASAPLAPELSLRVTGLAEALGEGPSVPEDGDGLARWKGELRSGARANLLMGVASNRVDVKQAAAAAERTLERIAEPLCAVWMPAAKWPSALLDDAWLAVIRNAAHDSSCACSIDEVCAAVLGRYRSATRTAEDLATRALDGLAAQLTAPGLVVVNPTSRRRGGVLELSLPGVGPAGDAQVAEEHPEILRDEVLGADAARAWLSKWRGQDLGGGLYVLDAEDEPTADGVALTLRCSTRFTATFFVTPVRDRVLAGLGDGALHLRVLQDPFRRVLCRVEDIPAYGWARWIPAPMAVDPVRAGPEPHSLTNGLITIAAGGATFSVDGLDGFGRLVESGDHGDTYNYCPPDHDLVVADPIRSAVRVLETGPVRGRIEIDAVYDWPRQVDDDSHERVGRVPTPVTTVLELRAGEPWVRVSHRWDNQSRDHRVRALIPLPHTTEASHAECAFGVVRRGLRAEGGPTERALSTYPSRRFVRADDVTVVHDGLLEYELVGHDGMELPSDATSAPALALTLQRSTGMLSRVDLPYRPVSAGPPVPTPGAQLEGAATVLYAVSVDPAVDPYAMADEVLIPLRLARVPGGGPVTDDRRAGLTVDGAEVSALRRERGGLTVRVFNPHPEVRPVRIEGRQGWVEDLRGRPLDAFDGTMELGPWQIATVRLDAEPTT
jgi:mannosylglycerate hydrolase